MDIGYQTGVSAIAEKPEACGGPELAEFGRANESGVNEGIESPPSTLLLGDTELLDWPLAAATMLPSVPDMNGASAPRLITPVRGEESRLAVRLVKISHPWWAAYLAGACWGHRACSAPKQAVEVVDGCWGRRMEELNQAVDHRHYGDHPVVVGVQVDPAPVDSNRNIHLAHVEVVAVH